MFKSKKSKHFFKNYVMIVFLVFFVTNTICVDDFHFKLGIFVQKNLADEFYEVFNLKETKNSFEFLKSFVISTYSFAVGEFFTNQINKHILFDTHSYVTHIQVLNQNETFKSLDDFCLYQSDKNSENKWNIAVYTIKKNSTMNIDSSNSFRMCDKQKSCILDKNTISFGDIEPIIKSTILHFESRVFTIAFEILKLALMEYSDTILSYNFYFFTNSSSSSTVVKKRYLNQIEYFFKANYCNNYFESDYALQANDYLTITKEEFCQKFDLISPSIDKKVQLKINHSQECVFFWGDCYHDEVLPTNSFLTFLPPGIECQLENQTGICLGDICVTRDLFNMYIHRPHSQNDHSFQNTEYLSANLKSSEATSYIKNPISDLDNSRKHTETNPTNPFQTYYKTSSASPEFSFQLINIEHTSKSLKTNDETSSKIKSDPASTLSEMDSAFSTTKTLSDIKNTNFQSFNQPLSNFTFISTIFNIPSSQTNFESKATKNTRISETNSKKAILIKNSSDEFDLIYLVPIFIGIFALLICVTIVILICMFSKKKIFNRD